MPRVKHRSGSLMVWPAISWHSLDTILVADGHIIAKDNQMVQTMYPEDGAMYQDDVWHGLHSHQGHQ